MSTFQGWGLSSDSAKALTQKIAEQDRRMGKCLRLAQEAVDLCMRSLKEAAQKSSMLLGVRRRSGPPCWFFGQVCRGFGVLVQKIAAQLRCESAGAVDRKRCPVRPVRDHFGSCSLRSSSPWFR